MEELKSFFSYKEERTARSEITLLGWLYRILWILILFVYVTWYTVFHNKTYQATDQAISATATNVRGVTTCKTDGIMYDSHDLVVPPQENDEFFLMTNPFETLRQTRGHCAEDPAYDGSQCANHTDCVEGTELLHGVATGLCLLPEGVCEIFAWCPVENTTGHPIPNEPLLDVQNFTALIKNQILFPKFDYNRRNILPQFNSTYFENCMYDGSHPINKFCPVFQLGYMVKEAGEDYNQIAAEGGFILIRINWDCDLDYSDPRCDLDYSFTRLDDKDSEASPGWSFRFGDYYWENGTKHRDLTLAYGIRFIIKVTGKAGKFNLVRLGFALGSGIGLLSMAGVVTWIFHCFCKYGYKCCCCDRCEEIGPPYMIETPENLREMEDAPQKSYLSLDNCLTGAFKPTPTRRSTGNDNPVDIELQER